MPDARHEAMHPLSSLIATFSGEPGHQPAAVAGIVAAAVVGATGALHCYLMCGPLACAALGATGERRAPGMASYQLGRVVAYALVGALLGAAGDGVGRALSVSVRPLLPWLLVVALVATALDLGKRLAPLPGVASCARAAHRASSRLPPLARAAAFGALTPLLPCGLLYGVLAAAAAAGSAPGGALILGAFALGGAPALFIAQLQADLLRRRPRVAGVILQRVVPLAAAAILVYRTLAATSGGRCH